MQYEFHLAVISPSPTPTIQIQTQAQIQTPRRSTKRQTKFPRMTNYIPIDVLVNWHTNQQEVFSIVCGIHHSFFIVHHRRCHPHTMLSMFSWVVAVIGIIVIIQTLLTTHGLRDCGVPGVVHIDGVRSGHQMGKLCDITYKKECVQLRRYWWIHKTTLDI